MRNKIAFLRHYIDLVILGLFVFVAILYAGSKPRRVVVGRDGVDSDRCLVGGGQELAGSSAGAVVSNHVDQIAENDEQIFVAMLEDEDVSRGFVLSKIGVDEEFDFTMPSNAVIHRPWKIRGASIDQFVLPLNKDDECHFEFPFGTNVYERTYVSSRGMIAFDRRRDLFTNAAPCLAAFHGVLGIVPEPNWRYLSDGAQSRFWSLKKESSYLFTWENVLYNRTPDNPLSFQIELFDDGNFVFRYDFSRLSEPPTNVIVAAANNGTAFAFDLMNFYGLENLTSFTNLTSLSFQALATNETLTSDLDGDGLSLQEELSYG